MTSFAACCRAFKTHSNIRVAGAATLVMTKHFAVLARSLEIWFSVLVLFMTGFGDYVFGTSSRATAFQIHNKKIVLLLQAFTPVSHFAFDKTHPFEQTRGLILKSTYNGGHGHGHVKNMMAGKKDRWKADFCIPLVELVKSNNKNCYCKTSCNGMKGISPFYLLV